MKEWDKTQGAWKKYPGMRSGPERILSACRVRLPGRLLDLYAFTLAPLSAPKL